MKDTLLAFALAMFGMTLLCYGIGIALESASKEHGKELLRGARAANVYGAFFAILDVILWIGYVCL